MIKYGLPILAVLSLLFAISATIRMTPVQVRAEPLSAPPSSPFPHQIGAIGLVEASNENVAIGAPVAGLTTAVYVKTGDRVTQGQPLFSLDDRDLRAELSLRESNAALARARLEKLLASPRREELLPAQAAVGEAEALLNDARTQLRLVEAVKDRRAVREEDVLKRRSAVDIATARLAEANAKLALLEAGAWERDVAIARAELAHAEQQVERTRTDIVRMTVRSPADGVVLQRKIRVGEYAATGGLSQPHILLVSVRATHLFPRRGW